MTKKKKKIEEKFILEYKRNKNNKQKTYGCESKDDQG